ncbi:MAG: nucleotide exchange factor GrpE [Epulopiscium sp.]|nr:nucleotide exchange factor GrpE [Candidatus Epulonipiscium sp.]
MLKDYPPVLLKSKGLVEAWRDTLQAFDKFIEENIRGCFFHIKMKVMLRILHHLIEENKLSKYDEKIFEYYDHLMLHYKNSIELFYNNEEKVKTGKSKEILTGICDVLSAQLRQFKENQLASQGISDEKAIQNPIKVEKDNFLTEEKIDILNQLDALEKQWTEKKMKACVASFRKYINIVTENEDKEIELIEKIYEALLKDLKDALYTGYVKKTNKGIKKLNDFHLRKAANFYYESIKQEKENIEAIIKIQVKALEDEMEKENYDKEEEQIIQEILHTIREAYQHLGKEIEELELFFKESEEDKNKIVLFTSEEFDKYLKEQGLKSYINDIQVRKKLKLEVDEPTQARKNFDFVKQIWEELKADLLKIYLEKINLEAFIGEMNQRLQNNIELSSRVNQLFVQFLRTYEEQKEKFNEESGYLPIIEGIYETISIKVESIEENITGFHKTIEEINLFFSEEASDAYFESEFIKLAQEIFAQFIKEPAGENFEEESFLSWGEEYFNKAFEEAFIRFSQKVEMVKEKLCQEVNLQINKFLKEYLLFEVSTYEEIVNYSVSRLREESDDFAIEYVKNIDQLTASLEETLKEFEIEFVEPVPHDKFNGKEHEVLLAEEREGFKKGEIIKTLNKGYRFNNQIILKANVVASK